MSELRRSFEIKGKVAIVTGGGTGIGKALAEALVSEGARVVLNGRREVWCAEVPSEITQPNVRAYIHDVTRPTPTLKSPVRWQPGDADRFFEAATALRDLGDLGRGWSEVVLGCNAPPSHEGFSAGDARR